MNIDLLSTRFILILSCYFATFTTTLRVCTDLATQLSLHVHRSRQQDSICSIWDDFSEVWFKCLVESMPLRIKGDVKVKWGSTQPTFWPEFRSESKHRLQISCTNSSAGNWPDLPRDPLHTSLLWQMALRKHVFLTVLWSVLYVGHLVLFSLHRCIETVITITRNTFYDTEL